MAYEKITGIFKSSNGADRIQYYVYKPEGEIRAIIQISHGMCECIETYEEAIAYFCEKGILVCGNDHLGHGASVSSKEGYGYFAKEDGWIYLIKDLKKMNRYIRKEYPDVPLYLLGHSMGSFVARLYTAQYGKSMDGAIYMGTSGTVPGIPFCLGIIKAMRKKKGGHYRSEFVQKVAFGAYNDHYKEENDAFSWLCQDPGFRKRYVEDERHNFIFTLAGFEDLVTMLHHISTAKCYKKMPKNLPYLILAGEEDPVCQYGKGAKEFYEKMAMAGCLKLTMKLYKDQRHVLLRENIKTEVMDKILLWMEKDIESK